MYPPLRASLFGGVAYKTMKELLKEVEEVLGFLLVLGTILFVGWIGHILFPDSDQEGIWLIAVGLGAVVALILTMVATRK